MYEQTLQGGAEDVTAVQVSEHWEAEVGDSKKGAVNKTKKGIRFPFWPALIMVPQSRWGQHLVSCVQNVFMWPTITHMARHFFVFWSTEPYSVHSAWLLGWEMA